MASEPNTEATPTGIAAAAQWLMRRPVNMLLGATSALTSLPLVGKSFEPVAGFAAMGAWGYRHVPEALRNSVASALSIDDHRRRREEVAQTHAAVESGLRAVLPAIDLDVDWPGFDAMPPFLRSLDHRKMIHRTSVSYGPHSEQVLDIWRRDEVAATDAPVLIFVPGGGWVHGKRALQGYALLSHLANMGWVCVSMGYRVAPTHRWPRHVFDVKEAIAWVRTNIAQYGGSPDFVAIAGASAGGHLAALAGLTPEDSSMSAHLPPGSHTSVDAVVGIYGRYDWADRSTPERQSFVEFLEHVVVGERIEENPAVFDEASPISRVHSDAPPFLVVHGSRDSLIPVWQAQRFVEALRAVSRQPVGYIELPGAGHAFDMFDGARTGITVMAIGLFLDRIHRNWSATQRCRFG